MLADELRVLGAAACDVVPGGVAFEGDLELAYRANLHSRLASRVLLAIGAARYRDTDALYKIAASIEWERHFRADQTLRVDVTAIRSPLRSINFATLRVKDGIVDRLRERCGERPSIDTRRPDVRVFVFLAEREATFYLDLSGESLFKRGWRHAEDKGEAPLKENLAAGLLMLAGWQPSTPLLDPFCGSGTIVIEAAQMAAGIAPGISRTFGFQKLAGFDAALWEQVRLAAIRAAQRHDPGRIAPRIAASDHDPVAIRQIRRNLERAGIAPDTVRIGERDVGRSQPPFDAPGMIVTNPPYGERLELAGGGDWAAVGRRWRDTFGGWTVCVLTSDRDLPRRLGLRESRKTPLFNGALDCRLFRFDVHAGPKPGAADRDAGQAAPADPLPHDAPDAGDGVVAPAPPRAAAD